MQIEVFDCLIMVILFYSIKKVLSFRFPGAKTLNGLNIVDMFDFLSNKIYMMLLLQYAQSGFTFLIFFHESSVKVAFIIVFFFLS